MSGRLCAFLSLSLVTLFAVTETVHALEDPSIPPGNGRVSFRQPLQQVTEHLWTGDQKFHDDFETDSTSVPEVRIGDAPKGHIWQEREVNLTSGNTQGESPEHVNILRKDLPPDTPMTWMLIYRENKLKFIFDGSELEVPLYEPASEILIRARATKSGTRTLVTPEQYVDQFKDCTYIYDYEEVCDSDDGEPRWHRTELEHLTNDFVMWGTVEFTYDPEDPPLRSHLAFQIKIGCKTPPIEKEGGSISHGPWRGNYVFTEAGMEHIGVRSMRRQFAEAILVPHCTIRNSLTTSNHYFKLCKENDGYWKYKKLIKFREVVTSAGTGALNKKAYAATFHMASDYECMRITQWYEYSGTVNPFNAAEEHLTPYPHPAPLLLDASQIYPAEKIQPITYYEWLPRKKNCELVTAAATTRCEWPIKAQRNPKNACAIAMDPITLGPGVGSAWDDELFRDWGLYFLAGNCLRNEASDRVAVNNQIRVITTVSRFLTPDLDVVVDNYHYSDQQNFVDGPAGILGNAVPPGGPSLHHCHWHWSAALGWPDGDVLYPKAEKGCMNNMPQQNIDIYIMRSRLAERYNLQWSNIGGELLSKFAGPQYPKQAFAYRGSSADRSNAFFAHGMAFNGRYSRANERNNYRNFRQARRAAAARRDN